MSSLKNKNTGFRFRAGFAAIVTAAILAGCSQEVVETPEVIRPVKVLEIAEADHLRKLEYSGSVKARYETHLGFRVSGKVVERRVDIGQRVGPGALLARIDAADYELAVRRAEADVAAAKKQVEIFELARRRAEQLFAKNAASKSELEQRILGHDQAVSAFDAAQSALEQARNQVAYTELHADVTGIVTAANAEAGQVVGSGTPVVTVAVDGEKEVQIGVPEMDIAHFSVGKPVTARFWSDAALRLDGVVREISGSADIQSRTFSVRVSLPEDPRVLLGMTATIEAVIESPIGSYALPLAALSQKDGETVVWLVDRDKGTVRSRPVEVSTFSDNGVRIASGIQAGDVVVVAGTQFMKDDMKVRVAMPETQNAELTEARNPEGGQL